MTDVLETRLVMAAARKAVETAERVMSVEDEEVRADFVDAVVVGAVERLRGEGCSQEAVLLWRETFFSNYFRQTTNPPVTAAASDTPG